MNHLPTKEDFLSNSVSEPYAVQLTGLYDIWDKRNPDAELFQHGLRSQDLSDLWPDLLKLSFQYKDDNPVPTLLKQGRAIQYAQKKQYESIIKNYGFTFQWEGLTFLGCNHPHGNSFLFEAGIKEEHDALFRFAFDGKQWSVSLYHAPGKEHLDLSLIAVKYGGGGHREACGFVTSKLPFMN